MPQPGRDSYALKLFVRGHSSGSARTIQTVRDSLEEHVHGRYSLQVIDVHQQPGEASAMHVLATPTLVRVSPGPSMRCVGSMHDIHAAGRLNLV